MIKFIKTQENSDATCNYNIEFPKEYTIEDICNDILAHSIQAKERGKIYISRPENLWYATIGNYYHSVLEFKKDYYNHKNREIERIWANGGYGAMSYYITLKEE